MDSEFKFEVGEHVLDRFNDERFLIRHRFTDDDAGQPIYKTVNQEGYPMLFREYEIKREEV